jgi:hypothetical protein
LIRSEKFACGIVNGIDGSSIVITLHVRLQFVKKEKISLLNLN